MADHPFPELEVQPGSGLSFPWAFKTDSRGPGDANFGPTGSRAVEVMIINDEDTDDALQELLGYSWRDASTYDPPTTGATLRRVLPFQHPYYTQLYCTRIVKSEGVSPLDIEIGIEGAPFQAYNLLYLTLEFSRPPYALLEDDEIGVDPTTGVAQEWLRYTTWVWSPGVEMLSREGTTFNYTSGTGPMASGQPFPGSIGYPVVKTKLTMTWHQLPQFGIYDANNFPNNVLYDFFNGDRLTSTVNASSFFDVDIGLLLYIVPEIVPHPLQLPPDLMKLGNENFLLQYDAILHFLFFDPPLGPGATGPGGHNTAPWADGFWYPVASVQGGNPPFASTQFSSIFQIN